MTEIPYGYCQCGCGEKTNISKVHDKARGQVKGEPWRFVSGHYARTRLNKPIDDRFWSKVDKSGGIDACWIWTAFINKAGYGRFGVGGRSGKPLNAHRVAWELTNGAIPDGLWVLHNCPGGDNPACVNPSHMFLGTHQDNTNDKVKKGRQSKGEKHGLRTHHSGNRLLKLTVDQVIYIRERYALGGISERQLAKQFGISGAYVHSIVRRECWKHIK
jgi:hypothetical protein